MVNAKGITRPEDKAQRKGFGASFARQDRNDTLVKPFSTPVGDAKDCPLIVGILANGHPNAPESTTEGHIARIPFVADLRLNAPDFP
jgi:hypothetical protein